SADVRRRPGRRPRPAPAAVARDRGADDGRCRLLRRGGLVAARPRTGGPGCLRRSRAAAHAARATAPAIRRVASAAGPPGGRSVGGSAPAGDILLLATPGNRGAARRR